MRFYHFLSVTSIISLFLSSCATSQPKTSTADWSSIVSKSAVFSQNHTGFFLYDIQQQTTLAEYQAERYFTPASNTKLFTFYAGLCMLGDSVPALRYMTRGDSLIFWGTGDPTLLHPDMPASAVFGKLQNWPGKLYYYPYNYTGKRFGAGWSWADYSDYYQCELGAFPIYGNVVRFTNQTVKPRIFKDSLRTSGWAEKFELSRDEFTNQFYSKGWPTKSFEHDIPFRTSPMLSALLLTDTLKKEVRILSKLAGTSSLPINTFSSNTIAYKTLYSIPLDTLYRRMMQVSDNMLAEQLLLLCASQLDTFSMGFDSKKAIEYMKSKYLSDLLDEPIWVDGSGLSRYNLFTPRSIGKLLLKIYQKIPDQARLFGMFAIGGKSGTIKGQYRGAEPYIFAKTGTLSNNYSLSGYLRTKRGKILIFSFMNSNYTRKTSEIRAEVERILTSIYEKY